MVPLRSPLLASMVSLLGTLAATGCAPPVPAKAPAPTAIVPLRSLRLYETGVGYFERTGTVGSGEQALPVPAGHLDDALKSLVIIGGEGGVEVTGVQFTSNTSKAFARAQAGLPDKDGAIAYQDILGSLRGAAVTVTTRTARGETATLRGRLVDLEDELAQKPKKTRAKDPPEADEPEPSSRKESTLTILAPTGEIVRMSTREVASLLPDDPALVKRLGAALDILSSRNAQTPRLLRLRAKTTAPVTFGYIAETPIWRTSYRLILDQSGQGATLQSWALVHNDTDEEWRGVTLSLVNGRPDSFLFPLAAPRYGRRTLVHPETQLSTVPQLLDTTVDSMWGDSAGEVFASGGLGLSGVGEGGGGRGEGIGLGGVGTVGASDSTLLSVGDLGKVQSAVTEEGNAQFTYTSRTPLDLAAHSSGLVPLLSSKVEIEPVAFFADPHQAARAALRFTNTTGQTLPAGTVAIFADGGFAGESALDRLKPGQSRMVGFGMDLDIEIHDYREEITDDTKRVTWDGRVLAKHFLRTRKVTLELENRSGRDRAVVVRFSLHRNAKVEGVDAVQIDPVTEQPQLLFQSAPKSRVKRPFSAVEGLSSQHDLGHITREVIDALLAAEGLPAGERASLKEAAIKASARDETGRVIEKAKGDVARVEKDLERLREHLKASKEGGGQNPLVRRVLDAEDALTAARKREEKGEAEVAAREKGLREALEKLPKPVAGSLGKRGAFRNVLPSEPITTATAAGRCCVISRCHLVMAPSAACVRSAENASEKLTTSPLPPLPAAPPPAGPPARADDERVCD